MLQEATPGQIVILNGTPRSGKSSIATVIQNTFEGVWMNLGVDRFKQMTPDRYQPGIGLRPGGERRRVGAAARLRAGAPAPDDRPDVGVLLAKAPGADAGAEAARDRQAGLGRERL